MTPPSICPDCGRLKAANVSDLRHSGCCPKWYASRDRDAEEDCQQAAAKVQINRIPARPALYYAAKADALKAAAMVAMGEAESCTHVGCGHGGRSTARRIAKTLYALAEQCRLAGEAGTEPEVAKPATEADDIAAVRRIAERLRARAPELPEPARGLMGIAAAQMEAHAGLLAELDAIWARRNEPSSD